MGNALPLFFTILTGLCLAMVFFALWRSLSALMGPGALLNDRGANGGSDRQALLNEKQALLQGLRDLEQERDMGKVSQDDFETVNARLRARAREVIKQLDAQVAPFRAKAEAMVPAVAAMRTVASESSVSVAAPVAPPVVDSSISHACPKCQTKNESDAVFCKKCGHKLANGEGEQA